MKIVCQRNTNLTEKNSTVDPFFQIMKIPIVPEKKKANQSIPQWLYELDLPGTNFISKHVVC